MLWDHHITCCVYLWYSSFSRNKLYSLVTVRRGCKQLVRSCYAAAPWPGIELLTSLIVSLMSDTLPLHHPAAWFTAQLGQVRSCDRRNHQSAGCGDVICVICWHTKSTQHLDAVVSASPNPGSRTRPQPAIDHYNTVSTFHDDNICETCFSMLCTSCLELTSESDCCSL